MHIAIDITGDAAHVEPTKWYMNLFMTHRVTDVENKHVVEERLRGVINWENGLAHTLLFTNRQINKDLLIQHRELYTMSVMTYMRILSTKKE